MHAFAGLVRELLSKGALFVLPDKVNQDKLEEHFGRQRSRLGGNENPTLKEYGETELKLQVAKSSSIRVMRGNTRGRSRDDDVDTIDINDQTMLP